MSNKIEAIKRLRALDHCFVSESGCKQISEPFGITVRPSVVKASPNEPKGLTLHSGAKEAVGMDAADLAEIIASRYAGFKPYQSGRGFRLRSACDAIEQRLADNEAADAFNANTPKE